MPRRVDKEAVMPEEDQRTASQWIGMILLPPRTILAFVVGSAVLTGRAAQWIASRAVEEGERQLSRLTRSEGSNAATNPPKPQRRRRKERGNRGGKGGEPQTVSHLGDPAHEPVA